MSSEDDLEKRIAKLESWAHPPKDLKEFEDYQEMDERLRRLEELWQQIEKKQ